MIQIEFYDTNKGDDPLVASFDLSDGDTYGGIVRVRSGYWAVVDAYLPAGCTREQAQEYADTLLALAKARYET